MNGFDITITVLAAILMVAGLWKGLVRILVTIAALIAAFLVASRLHDPLAALWGNSPDGPSPALQLLAYILLFLAVMLVGGAIAFFARKIVKAALLSWADRIAGAALGLAAAALASALLVLPVVAYTPEGKTLLSGSVLAPYVTAVADLVSGLAPPDLAERYREGIRELRSQWDAKNLV